MESFLAICERSTHNCPKLLSAMGEELFSQSPASWLCSILLQWLGADPAGGTRASSRGIIPSGSSFFPRQRGVSKPWAFLSDAQQGLEREKQPRGGGEKASISISSCHTPIKLLPITNWGGLQNTGRMFHLQPATGQINPPSSAKAGVNQMEAFPCLRKGPRGAPAAQE